MVEGDDLHQPVAEPAVEERIGATAHNADMLAGQLHRLVVLDLQIVIVDPPAGEAELGRFGRAVFILDQLALRLTVGRSDLFTHHRLQTLGGGLDGALVDVAADPAAAEFLGQITSGSGARKAVQYYVCKIGRSFNDTF